MKKNLELEYKLLSKIEEGKNISQRSISKELNVALGLANSLIKKLVKKGFLKFKEAPMKRYFYYLTPKGLIEKTKLAREFMESSLQFYNKLKDEYEKEFQKITNKGSYNVFLIGISDLTDIAILAAKLQNLEIAAIIDKSKTKNEYCGVKVIKEFSNVVNKKNYFILTTGENVSNLSKKIEKKFKIFKPKFLMFS